MEPVLISAKLLLSKDLAETLRFAYASDPIGFVKAFNDAGIAIDTTNQQTVNADIDYLVKLSTSKDDVAGVLKNAKGQPVKFNVWQVLYNMDVDHDNLNNSGIKLI